MPQLFHEEHVHAQTQAPVGEAYPRYIVANSYAAATEEDPESISIAITDYTSMHSLEFGLDVEMADSEQGQEWQNWIAEMVQDANLGARLKDALGTLDRVEEFFQAVVEYQKWKAAQEPQV